MNTRSTRLKTGPAAHLDRRTFMQRVAHLALSSSVGLALFEASGAPLFTQQGRAELTIPWRYITSPPPALFDPANSKEYASVSSAAEQAMLAVIQMDPTLGLYSQTAFNQGLPAQDAF